MLWLKAFHVVGDVMWFAGLFYLPRLFVYHADAKDSVGIERFKVMERRLYIMMNVGMGIAVLFGIAMIVGLPAYMRMPWLHAKLFLVALLIAYHLYCGSMVKRFAAGTNQHTSRWYRGFNEVPSVLLIGIVILAVVKPF